MTSKALVRTTMFLLSAFIGGAQVPGPVLPNNLAEVRPLLTMPQMNELCGRMGQLMEAGGVAIPELQRASAPVIENTRQDCSLLRLRPGRGDVTYSLLTNVKAYLALSDAVPKPFPFPETAQRQVTELRDDAFRLDAHFRALVQTRERLLLNPDPANLSRYAEANRKLATPAAAKPRVVFFGDSITDFWHLNEYFPESDFINRGIGGQTSGQLVQRIKDDVIDLHPAAVLILVGTNDLAREVPVTAIESNYQIMADLASAYKIKVIFASVLPVSDYHKDQDPMYERTTQRPPALIRALNEWLEKYCSQGGHVYLNYHAALVDQAGQIPAELADDGLHPNAKGYRIMAPLASAAIRKATAATGEALPQKPRKRGLASIVK